MQVYPASPSVFPSFITKANVLVKLINRFRAGPPHKWCLFKANKQQVWCSVSKGNRLIPMLISHAAWHIFDSHASYKSPHVVDKEKTAQNSDNHWRDVLDIYERWLHLKFIANFLAYWFQVKFLCLPWISDWPSYCWPTHGSQCMNPIANKKQVQRVRHRQVCKYQSKQMKEKQQHQVNVSLNYYAHQRGCRDFPGRISPHAQGILCDVFFSLLVEFSSTRPIFLCRTSAFRLDISPTGKIVVLEPNIPRIHAFSYFYRESKVHNCF